MLALCIIFKDWSSSVMIIFARAFPCNEVHARVTCLVFISVQQAANPNEDTASESAMFTAMAFGQSE